MTTLTPVMESEKHYWAKDIGAVCKLGRPMLTKMKRQFPDDVVRCRAGDMIRGSAVIAFLKTWRQPTP
jgi:hypothetical protein